MALDIVAGVMGTGGRPVVVGEAEIARLMRERGEGRVAAGRYRFMRSNAEYDPGDRVRVSAGPFEGRIARVIEIGAPQTRAVLEALGGQVPVEIRADWLEPDR
jgi:transcription antitermination factor NusG